jgi:hypothetical protein
MTMEQIIEQKSAVEIEAEIEQIKSEEKLERIASFFRPIFRAVLLTAAILYIFNHFIV